MALFGASEHDLQNQAEQHDKDMAELNQQIWLQQQEYLNAYNDPSQQVQRLESAGINPNLALQQVSAGNGSDVSGGKGTTQSYAASLAATQQRRATDAGIARNMGDIANEMSDVQTRRYNAETQRSVASADIALKAEQRGLISEQKAGQVIQNELDTQFGSRKRQSEIDLNKMREEEAASNAYSAVIRANNDQKRVENETAETNQKIENMKQDVRESVARIRQLNSQADLNNSMKRQVESTADYIDKKVQYFDVTDVTKSKAIIRELKARGEYFQKLTHNADLTDTEKLVYQACADGILMASNHLWTILEDMNPMKMSSRTPGAPPPVDPSRHYQHTQQRQIPLPNGGTQTDTYSGWRLRTRPEDF